MWRRVSCEQPLHTSQSILSPRGNPMQMPAFTLCENSLWKSKVAARRAKGNPVPIPEPGRGTVSRRARAERRKLVGVTQHDPEKPSGGLGRVFFSV